MRVTCEKALSYSKFYGILTEAELWWNSIIWSNTCLEVDKAISWFFILSSIKPRKNWTVGRYQVWEYIYSCFEVLHTTGVNYIVEDIDLYIETRQTSWILYNERWTKDTAEKKFLLTTGKFRWYNKIVIKYW